MPKSAKTSLSQRGWCNKPQNLQFQSILTQKFGCSQNARNQPKSTVELDYMCPHPKSLHFYSLWLINYFSIRLVKRALINVCVTTLGIFSDSLRFFQYEISPLIFRPFSKKLMVGVEDVQLWFWICLYIKQKLMNRLSDH